MLGTATGQQNGNQDKKQAKPKADDLLFVLHLSLSF